MVRAAPGDDCLALEHGVQAPGRSLHAKTGSMAGVSSLSGYIQDADGRRLVFSMLSNNYLGDAAPIRALENRLAVALTQWRD